MINIVLFRFQQLVHQVLSLPIIFLKYLLEIISRSIPSLVILLRFLPFYHKLFQLLPPQVLGQRNTNKIIKPSEISLPWWKRKLHVKYLTRIFK